jgi:signal transduction histidine kinase
VSLLPTAILTLLAFAQARNVLEKEIARNLLAQASTAMAQIDWMLFERLENVRTWTQLEVLQEVRIGDIDKRVSHLLADLKSGHEVYDQIFCTTREGKIVAASDQLLLGQLASPQPTWLSASFGRTTVSLEPLSFPSPLQDTKLVLRAPIPDAFRSGETIGTLYAVFDWDQILHILNAKEQHAAANSEGRRTILLDREGRIIAASSLLRRPELFLSSPVSSWLPSRAMPTHVKTVAGDPLGLPEVLVGIAQSRGYQHFPGFGWSTLVIQPTPQAFSSIHRMGFSFLILLAFTAVIAIGASLLIASQLARPILSLTAFTRRFAQGRPLPALPSTGLREVGELTASFFQMIQDLERSREQLVRAAKLAVVGEMAAAMAHEVRTPLGVLRTSAQMLQREPRLSAEGQEMAGFIVSETDRLNRLIATLLDLARPRPPVFHKEDIHRIIRRAVELLAQRATRKQIRVEEHFQAASATIPCDGEQLLQVFLNLFLNALQFLPDKGVLMVRTESTPEHLMVTVADNGPGVSSAHRERIFDPFFTTRPDGVGLGLTIVQQIVHTHGGEIFVRDNPGGGACFCLSLPRVRSTDNHDETTSISG